MPELDLLIRGAQPRPEVGIADGRVACLSAASAREERDATGMLMMPGVVDAHVHFNEPGRMDWEGWATGSRAAIAGGVTTVCDMPLNSTPPVVDAAAFDAKHSAASRRSICDFALWGGLIPGRIDRMEELAQRGVMGFKAFMIDSGVEDFPRADLDTLRIGMKKAADLGLPVAVHAELDLGMKPEGSSVRDFLRSRPVDMELDAIRAALDLAGESGCALHVVHVSTAEGVALIADAKRKGVDVTCETCPHYLLLTDVDMEHLGAVAKCAPPMRDKANRTRLRSDLLARRVDTVGSDHSPAPWDIKSNPDFSQAWGGISSVQHTLPLLLTDGVPPDLISHLASETPATRFRLPGKGRLQVGMDADLVLLDMGCSHEITSAELLYRHRHSPYVGRRLSARVRQTLRRGVTVFNEGAIQCSAGGKLIKPEP